MIAFFGADPTLLPGYLFRPSHPSKIENQREEVRAAHEAQLVLFPTFGSFPGFLDECDLPTRLSPVLLVAGGDACASELEGAA